MSSSLYVRYAGVLVLDSASVYVRLPVRAVSPCHLLIAAAALQEKVLQADIPVLSIFLQHLHVSLFSASCQKAFTDPH